MDCECQKNTLLEKSVWPKKEDETGEMVFQTKEGDLFDRIINRRKYDYTSDEDDDLFLEELTKKVTPKKEITKDEDEFLSQLRTNTHQLEKTDRDKVFDSGKEEQIRVKLYKLR
jgi:hypothetical protein